MCTPLVSLLEDFNSVSDDFYTSLITANLPAMGWLQKQCHMLTVWSSGFSERCAEVIKKACRSPDTACFVDVDCLNKPSCDNKNQALSSIPILQTGQLCFREASRPSFHRNNKGLGPSYFQSPSLSFYVQPPLSGQALRMSPRFQRAMLHQGGQWECVLNSTSLFSLCSFQEQW